MIYLAIFIALNIADAALTYAILKRGGVEKNPVIRWFISKLGTVAGLSVPKVIGIAWIAYLASLAEWAWWLVIPPYALIVAWNARVLHKINNRGNSVLK